MIGHPVSVLESTHNKNSKVGDHYFNFDENDWDDNLGQEEPLTWSLDEPTSLCDWTIQVTRISNSSSMSSRYAGKKDKKSLSKINRDQKDKVQFYHVHKAILSVG